MKASLCERYNHGNASLCEKYNHSNASLCESCINDNSDTVQFVSVRNMTQCVYSVWYGTKC